MAAKTVITDEVLRQCARLKFADTLEELNRIYRNVGTIPAPDLKFNLRGFNAGQAVYNKQLVRINMDHLRRHTKEMIDETIPHELAHIAAAKLFNERGHGQAWAGIMMALGLEPKRCYNYSPEEFRARRVPRPFVYACACGPKHRFTSIRHRKASSGKRQYRCRQCGSLITFHHSDHEITLQDLNL